MKNFVKNFIIILFIFLLISAVFSLIADETDKKQEVSLTKLAQEIEQGKIEKISVAGSEIEIFYKDETKGVSRKEPETSLIETLSQYGVSQENLRRVEIETKKEPGAWVLPFLMFVLPFLLFLFNHLL